MSKKTFTWRDIDPHTIVSIMVGVIVVSIAVIVLIVMVTEISPTEVTSSGIVDKILP